MRRDIINDRDTDVLKEKTADLQRLWSKKARTTNKSPVSGRSSIELIDGAIGYCLALLMFFLFFEHTNTMVTILVILPLALWIARMVLTGDFLLIGTPVVYPLSALVAMALISSFFSLDRAYSFNEFRGEAVKQALLFFIFCNNIRTDKHLRDLLRGLFAGAAAISVIGIAGYYMGATLYNGRTVSWYANQSYSSLGCYLSINFILGLAVIYLGKNRARFYYIIPLMGLYLWCIMLTFTRGVWIALAAGVISLSLARKKFKALMVLGSVIVILAVTPNPFQKRLISIADLKHYTVPGAILSDRVLSWKSALDMIRERPLTGIGYGPKLFEKVYPRYLYPEAKELMPYAHNLYLDTAVQMGVPGLIIFLWLIGAYLWGAAQRLRETSAPLGRAFILGSVSGVIVLLLGGMVHLLMFNELGLLIFILMGVTFSPAVTLRSEKPVSGCCGPAAAPRIKAGRLKNLFFSF